MEKKLRFFLLSLCILIGTAATAQVSTVTGRVIANEDEEPIAGASVIVKGTSLGSVTDVDGRFRIPNVPASADEIVVSFIGMETQEVKIGPNILVRLKSTIQALDEVVIQVAYGTAKRTSLTGAISSVDAKEITKRPVSSVASVLEGTTTGIQVNNTYGQPGESPSIRIRGFNTVNGDNSPLYVLDGVPFGGNISDLNSADIESISVLKGPNAAALYPRCQRCYPDYYQKGKKRPRTNQHLHHPRYLHSRYCRIRPSGYRRLDGSNVARLQKSAYYQWIYTGRRQCRHQ